MIRILTGRWVITGLALILVLGIIFYAPFGGAMRGTLAGLMRPAVDAVHTFSLSLRRFGAWVEDRFIKSDEERQFRRERESLIVERARLEEINRENVSLRALLGLKERGLAQLTALDVAGNFSEDRDEYLILSPSSDSFLKEGDAVFSPAGAFVGIIRTVSENSATVRIISSPSETMTVRIHPSGVEAVFQGDNNDEGILALVPESAEIQIGDVVTTAGRNAGIPAGIPIGDVVEIVRHTTDTFLGVRVKLAANTRSLERVFVAE